MATGPPTVEIVEKEPAGSRVIIIAVVAKYCGHLPLYRRSAMPERNALVLIRSIIPLPTLKPGSQRQRHGQRRLRFAAIPIPATGATGGFNGRYGTSITARIGKFPAKSGSTLF